MIIKLRKENDLISMCRQMVIISHYHNYQTYNDNQLMNTMWKK